MDRESWIWEEAQRLAMSRGDIELEYLPQPIREALYHKAEENYQNIEFNKLVELWE